MIIPIFLPHLGCHDRCIYCNQAYITDIKGNDVRSTIKRLLDTHNGKYEVGLYGGNIFGVEPSILKKLFTYFEDYMDNIQGFRISTKPVPLRKETIEILKEHKVSTIELGIPTFNNEILHRLNRKHTGEDLLRAFYMLKDEGFYVALQVMVGLPDESFEDIKETVENIIQLNPHYIRIYPLVVLKETPLQEMYEEGLFNPISFQDAVERALFIYLNSLQHGIKVVKIGLTDNEIIKDRVIAGHYHPAFGYVVRSEGFYLAVKAKIEAASIKGCVAVSLNNRDIPHLLGYRRSNIDRFKEQDLHVTWVKDDIKEGYFLIKQRDKAIEGNIFDALSCIGT